MLRQSQSFSLCQWAVFLVLFAATTTRAETAAAVSPFFDRHEQGISVTESESESGVHRQIQQTLDAAMDRRRNLATGYLPNLPRYGSNSGSPTSNSAFTPPMTASGSGNSNGGSTGYMPTYDSGSATATDSQPPLTPLPQGSANGSGMPPPPPPLGGNGNGGSGIPPPAHPGMGKGYLGPGPGSNNVKKGLPKKGTKKGQTKGGGYSYGKGSGSGSGGTGSGNGTSSGTGNGMGSGNGTSSGSGTSSSGGGGGGRPMVTPHFDDDTLNTPATAQPCLCTASSCHCQNGVATDYEFVLVRDQIGSDAPSQTQFGVASGIGMNGHVYPMVYTTSGRSFGGNPIGLFKGFCVVTSNISGELLCSYEIYMYANGPVGLGGVVINGPVPGLQTGTEFQSLVTGTGFDFDIFSTGFLTAIQDPQKPILYSFLSLYV